MKKPKQLELPHTNGDVIKTEVRNFSAKLDKVLQLNFDSNSSTWNIVGSGLSGATILYLETPHVYTIAGSGMLFSGVNPL